MKQRLTTSILIAFLSIIVFPSTNVLAANPASFSLSPSVTTVEKGNSFTISVYENGDNVNAVTTKLTYNAAQLQLNSTNCGGLFASSIAETNGQTCFTTGGTTLNGNILALNATFTALANTGTASISIASGSKIVSSDTNTNIWNGGSSATNVTLTAPAPPTAPPQPTPVGSSTSTPPANGTATTNTASSGSAVAVTPQETNNNPSSTPKVAPEGEVKSATDTIIATTTTVARSNDITKKAIWTTIYPLLIALAVFLLLTYPTIFSIIKKAKITQFVQQKLTKIVGK